MHEGLGILVLVGEGAKSLQTLRQLDGIGRRMQHGGMLGIHHVHGLVHPAQPPGRVGIIQGAHADDPVHLQQQLGAQGLTAHLAEILHHPVVVEHHALAAVPRLASRPQHGLGLFARGGRTLQLAGGQRLLDQRAHEIAIPVLFGNGRRLHDHPAGGIPVDAVQRLEHRIRHAEYEGALVLVDKRKTLGCRVTGQLDSQPPGLGRKLVGRRAMTDLVPMQIAPFDQGALAERPEQRLRWHALHQVLQARRGKRWLHVIEILIGDNLVAR